MKIRLTPLRTAYLRGQFLEAVQTEIPHLSKAARESVTEFDSIFCIYPEDLAAQAAHLIEARMSAFYGPALEQGPVARHCDAPGYESQRAIHERSTRWTAYADLYQGLAKKRSLTGTLPADYSHDGEIRPQLAQILRARRDAWAAAGKPMSGEQWRTLDLSNPVVELATPTGGYKIQRGAVLADEERESFEGLVIIDDRLATFGGCYQIHSEEANVRRLVYMRGMVTPLVVARAVTRGAGPWFTKEVFRRLRAGCKPTFEAARVGRGRPCETRVALPPGKIPADCTARWQARADRIRELAKKRDAVIAGMRESARTAVRNFAAEPAIHLLEAQARLIAAERRWSTSREGFNAVAAKLGVKKTLGSLPLTQPVYYADMPRPRASLCDRDSHIWNRAELEFAASFEELTAARQAMETLAPQPEREQSPAVHEAAVAPAEPIAMALGQGTFGF